MRLIRLAGVHRPVSDTWMLADVLCQRLLGAGASVLELCAGTGAIALRAAQAGARATATDISWRCALSCRINARLNGVDVEVRRGDLYDAVPGRRFDVVVANPPYIPASSEQLPRHRHERSLDAGLDGRALIDRICDEAPSHLSPGGSVLLVHSSFNGVPATLERLGAAGLIAEPLARERGPLGPVVRRRARLLERRGLLEPGAREEEIVIVHGRRPSVGDVPEERGQLAS